MRASNRSKNQPNRWRWREVLSKRVAIAAPTSLTSLTFNSEQPTGCRCILAPSRCAAVKPREKTRFSSCQLWTSIWSTPEPPEPLQGLPMARSAAHRASSRSVSDAGRPRAGSQHLRSQSVHAARSSGSRGPCCESSSPMLQHLLPRPTDAAKPSPRRGARPSASTTPSSPSPSASRGSKRCCGAGAAAARTPGLERVGRAASGGAPRARARAERRRRRRVTLARAERPRVRAPRRPASLRRRPRGRAAPRRDALVWEPSLRPSRPGRDEPTRPPSRALIPVVFLPLPALRYPRLWRSDGCCKMG